VCQDGYCEASCTGCYNQDEDSEYPCEDDCDEKCTDCLDCYVKNDPCADVCGKDDDPFFCKNPCEGCLAEGEGNCDFFFCGLNCIDCK
jgi:hypothetical protein